MMETESAFIHIEASSVTYDHSGAALIVCTTTRPQHCIQTVILMFDTVCSRERIDPDPDPDRDAEC